MKRTDLTPPVTIRVNAGPMNPAGCATCGHSYALHGRGTTPCKAMGCRSKYAEAPGGRCPGFKSRSPVVGTDWVTEVARKEDGSLRVTFVAPIDCLVGSLDFYDSSPTPVHIASTVVMCPLRAGDQLAVDTTQAESDDIVLAFFDALQAGA